MRGDQQQVDRFLELILLPEDNECRGAKGPRLGLLVRAGTKDDSLRAHLGRELDGEMAQAADAQHADAHAGLVVRLQRAVDGRAGALERRRDGGRHGVGDLVHVAFAGDVVGCEGAVAVAPHAVDVALVAHDVVAREAVFACAAALDTS